MFIVYNKETTRIIAKVKSERAAKMHITRNNLKDEAAYAGSADFYDNIEKWVVRTNIMTGEPFQEPINTPPYMSPACDSFFSM